MALRGGWVVPKREKKAKPERKPRFKVGEVVHTRYAAKVRKDLPFGRRWLVLLPGTEWKVEAVATNGQNAPVYTMRCGEFEVRRREWQLSGVHRNAGPAEAVQTRRDDAHEPQGPHQFR